jgi:hypothetical protein
VVETLAVEGVATVPSRAYDREDDFSDVWLESCIERLEGKKPAKSFCTLMSTTR